MCNSPVNALSKYLTKLFWPYMKNDPRIITDSRTVIGSIRNESIVNKKWISFDVTALYPSVPIDKMIELLYDKIKDCPDFSRKTPFTVKEIRQFLDIVLNFGNYFVSYGQYYKMKNMGPIGNSLLTVGSECFVQDIESRALNSFTLTNAGFAIEDFEFWKHYVDTLNSVSDDFEVIKFVDYLNSFCPRIQFTYEVQEGSGFSFLDIGIICNENGSVNTSVFRKKTHTNLYTHFSSFSDKRAKYSVLQSSTRRALKYCSTEELLKTELTLIEDVAVANGWIRNDAKNVIAETEQKIYKEDLLKLRDPVQFQIERENKRKLESEKQRVVIPYPGHNIAGKFRRICSKYSITPAFRSNNTISNNLVNLKDPFTINEKSGVIYKIPLKCNKVYIGETGRLFGTRKAEHGKNINGNIVSDSAILEHLLECTVSCGEPHPGVLRDSCTILGQEKNKSQRLATESLHIKMNKQSVVNRGLGSLDPIWDGILENFRCGEVRERRRGRPGQSRRYERLATMNMGKA